MRRTLFALCALACAAAFAGEKEKSPAEQRLDEIAAQMKALAAERRNIRQALSAPNPDLKNNPAADKHPVLNRPKPDFSKPAKSTRLKASDSAAARLAAYADAKRYIVSRDFDTKPGYVIVQWYRNGKPDWKMPSVETQKLERVTGRRVESAMEKARDAAVAGLAVASNRIAAVQADLSSLSNRFAALSVDFSVASNRVAVLEAWKAGREERAVAAKKEIQDSKLLTTTLKNWLIGIIDRISGGDE